MPVSATSIGLPVTLGCLRTVARGGYVMEGAIRFELEGEPERVIKVGGTFWEPGGDVIHYQDGNALSDAPTKFLVTMVCAPGQPMLTLVDEGSWSIWPPGSGRPDPQSPCRSSAAS